MCLYLNQNGIVTENGVWNGNEKVYANENVNENARFRGCRSGNEPHITHDYGTPDPFELRTMQQGMTAQDAGASRAVTHAAGQNARASPPLAIKQSSSVTACKNDKGPVPFDLSVSELGSDDSFWMLSANAEREVFADQFFSLQDDYLNTLESYEPSSPFSPETQLMGGQFNPMFGTSSVVTNDYSYHNTDIYGFTGDYSGNAYEESQDAFLQHVFHLCNNAEVHETPEITLPYDGMLQNFEIYHTSVQEYWDKLKADQQMEFELMSDAKVVFVTDANGNCVPMATVMMLVKSINGVPCSKIMNVLLDSGGSASMISKKVLPAGVKVTHDNSSTMIATLAGAVHSTGKVELQGLRLPEFDRSLVIDSHTFLTFQAPCKYDMIVGSDFLSKYGFKLNYKTLEVEWFDNVIKMNTTGFTKERQAAFMDSYMLDVENEQWLNDGNEEIDSYIASTILDAKYEKVDIDTVISENCSHLSPDQQKDLADMLKKHEKLFDGTLGCYPHDKMSIELLPGSKPVYRRHYPVAETHKQTFKKELDHLESIGVLEKVQSPSLWCLPTFCIPKKDSRIRVVSDLRELNKFVKPVQYPIPVISDVLHKRFGYEFFTKLDVSMQFYTFELDDKAKDLCTISTPFGNYRYNRAPMGLKISPAFAQSKMEQCLDGIDEQDVYIDDVGVFTSDWQHHVAVLDKILTRLEDDGFTINPLKCEWAVKETDWLGYWLTPTGVKPWSKKVEAIVNMQRPQTATELRTFLGMVTYYREMWPRRAHILAPLTELSGLPKRAKVEWTPARISAFEQMKAVVAQDVLMAYPDHNKPFEIYTDASDYQLGACLMQEGRPVAYYSRKLSPAQQNYTTMEKELLAIVETLKEYRSMLLGADITIYTDHKNLTFENFNTQRVLRWRCFIEDFSPKLVYLQGKLNVLADAFSRLPKFEPTDAPISAMTEVERPIILAYFLARVPRTSSGDGIQGFNPSASLSPGSFSIDPILCHSLMNLPDEELIVESNLNLPHNLEVSPLRYQWLKQAQDDDPSIQQAVQNNPEFSLQHFGDIELAIYTPPNAGAETPWKIVLTDSTVEDVIIWFHHILGYPGRKRLKEGMRLFYHPRLNKLIDNYDSEASQRYKSDGRGYGYLPARQVRGSPWQYVDVDLIGPWTVKCGTGKVYEFNALTVIDRVTGLPEIIRIENKTAAHVASKFEECWLARYPRPEVCVHDGGGEFKKEFKELLYNFGISDTSTTPYNPQANSICERMHREVGNILRCLIHSNPPRTLANAKALVDSALATTMHVLRTNISQSTGNSPGALAFHRDMIMDISLQADMRAICACR